MFSERAHVFILTAGLADGLCRKKNQPLIFIVKNKW